MKRTTTSLSVSAAVAAILAGPSAIAQEPQQAQQRAAIEEIIVTAQKREQTLQEVPIAVSAFSSDQIERAGVQDIRDLMQIAPSLMLTSSASEAAGAVARIRGVGTTGDNPGLESSVAVFIDGVYRNRNSVALSDLGKIERIEVLRGPQGTLFGKNASAGLINVITQAPQYETSGYVNLSAGNWDYRRVAAGITAPIVDDAVAFRIDGSWLRRDGFVENIVSGQDYNDRDRAQARAQLLIEPGEVFSARLIGDVATREETCCAATTLVEGPTSLLLQQLGAQLVSPPAPFDRVASVTDDRGYQQDVDEWGLSGELEWDFDDWSVTSITAYRDWKNTRSHDVDYTNLDILYRDNGEFAQRFKTFTQELRVAGQQGRVDWMVGAFYADESLDLDDRIRVGADFEPFANALLTQATGIPGALSFISGIPAGQNFQDGFGSSGDIFEQEAQSWAIFTHNTIELTERLDLSVGMRYTEETKTIDVEVGAQNPACLSSVQRLLTGQIPAALGEAVGLVCLPFFNPLTDGAYAGRRVDQEWTGTVNLNYMFSDEVSGYISAGRGFKAGGFNLDRAGLGNPLTGAQPGIDDLEFGAETVDAYEIGLKSQLLDNLLTLNLAAFYSEFEDFQLNTFTGINFIVSNVEKARTQGIEADFQAFVTDELTFSGGVVYADARYGSNSTSPPGSVVPIAGKRLTNAPLWAASLSSTLDRPLTNDLYGLFQIDMRFTGNLNSGSDLLPQKEQGGVTVWNARMGVRTADDRWHVELWGRNLFDKDYQQVAFNAPLQGNVAAGTQTFNTFLAEPRTWGVTVRMNF